MPEEININKLEIPDFSMVLDEIYNGYVINYSEAGDGIKFKNFHPAKIQTLTMFMQIVAGLENLVPKREEYCQILLNALNSSLDRLLKDLKRGKHTFEPESMKELKGKNESKIEFFERVIGNAKNRIELLFNEIQDGMFHNFGGLDQRMFEIVNHFKWLEDKIEDYHFSHGMIDTFNEGVRSNGNLFKINYHINCLKNITGYIVLNNYPDKIPGYDELSETEREGLRPPNYKGELTKECIEDLEELAERYPDLKINDFFETAYNQKESCRKAVKEVDGERKKVDMKWSKLRDEVSRLNRDDIYYRNRKKRKK